MAEDFNTIFNRESGGISGDDVMMALWLGIQEQQTIIQSQNETINILKGELCLKDKTYSWC